MIRSSERKSFVGLKRCSDFFSVQTFKIFTVLIGCPHPLKTVIRFIWRKGNIGTSSIQRWIKVKSMREVELWKRLQVTKSSTLEQSPLMMASLLKFYDRNDCSNHRSSYIVA